MARFWIYFKVRAIGFTDGWEVGVGERKESRVRFPMSNPLVQVWKHLLLEP